MDTGAGPRTYALGHTQRELDRLQSQGDIFDGSTRDVLSRADLRSGMRVLDVGCGVGNVSMIAADLVGPTGSVTGIDNAADALSIARRRAKEAGHDWLSFAEADLYQFEAPTKFDAIIGRMILMHVADPVAAINALSSQLNEGGIIAFLEIDIGEARAMPAMRSLDLCLEWITSTYKRVGAEVNMGSRLHSVFRAAGYSPRLHGSTRIESGADSPAYRFTAETLASLLPTIIACGVATADEIDIDNLADRLRDEAVASDACIFLPRLVGAWATRSAA